MAEIKIARGKPAEYGQLIVKRRFRLTQLQTDLHNKNILDFGCGNGAQTIEFAGVNSTITAIDIDETDLQSFKKVLSDESIASIKVVKYDGRALPFAKHSFDLILSFEVLEHVLDEKQTLSELYRVLKPGGEIILSVPNKGWIFETHGAHLPILPWNRVPFFSWLPFFIHRRFAKARIYRRRDITRLLENSHFKVLQSNFITAPMDMIKIDWLRNFLRATIFHDDSTHISMLATAILVHVKKPHLHAQNHTI